MNPTMSFQRKRKKFEWIEQCEASFKKLKYLLTHALMLNIEYSKKYFIL